jgi:integrase
LTGLRYETDKGSFDIRDYQKEQPLSFSNLTQKYIQYKKEEIRSWGKISYHLDYAKDFFKNQNIKNIAEGELEDFLHFLPEHLSGKTKKNIFTTLHAFWAWVQKREKKKNPYFQVPEFPKIEYQLAWRKIVTKETQWTILEETKRIAPAKVYLGWLWLATYTNVRPLELINVKEGDFDLKGGTLEINYNKERKPKRICLLGEDVDLVKSFPTALPYLYFFRHIKNGQRFGPKYLNVWWLRACKNLGIKEVTLYPGTRHSSLTDIRERFGYDRAKTASGHSTNKAIDRYLITNPENMRELYAENRPGKELVKNFRLFGEG